jgi:hypothetical protein
MNLGAYSLAADVMPRAAGEPRTLSVRFPKSPAALLRFTAAQDQAPPLSLGSSDSVERRVSQRPNLTQ